VFAALTSEPTLCRSPAAALSIWGCVVTNDMCFPYRW
jgi:hypothetical protein